MPLETAITDKILKYLNKEVDTCIAEKVMGNAFQFGRPDIHGCWKGRCFHIEVKTPDHGNKASTSQKIYMKRWRKAGAICFVAYSVDDVKKVIYNDPS